MASPSIIRISPLDPPQDLLRHAVETLVAGGVIAFPTETVYGIGCLRSKEAAIRRIYEMKGRGWDKPLAVYLPDNESLANEAQINEIAQKLIGKFLPGPLTIILCDRTGEKTGYRISPHPVLKGLLRALPGPLVGTSANKSGEAESVTAREVQDSFNTGLDLIIDSGPSAPAPPSTVVDCTGRAPIILREGAVPASEILCSIE